MDQKTRTRWRKKCDALWYKIQHHRWKRCAVCGSPAVEIHHLVRKAHSATRTELLNGIGLCPEHHRGSELSPHGTPDLFEGWIKDNCPEIYYFLKHNKHRVERVDWKERYSVLQSEFD